MEDEGLEKVWDSFSVLDWRPRWVNSFFLQDPGEDVNLTPFTSRLCTFCAYVCVATGLTVHLTCAYSSTRPAVSDAEDPWMGWFLQLTANLSLAGLLYESAITISIRLMGLWEAYGQDDQLRLRLDMNLKMLLVFGIFTTCYHCMAFNYQYVHTGWLASYYGGHQVVYSVRFLEWFLCTPVLFTVIGTVPPGDHHSSRNGILPSAFLTGLYCGIAWQAVVVSNWYVSWFCIFLSFISYFIASVEQLAFAWKLKDMGTGGPLRAGLVLYLVVLCGMYGIMYLLPIPGWLSTTFENKFYCVFDASFKLGTSIVTIVVYDIALNDDVRREAQSSAADVQRIVDTANVPILGVDKALCITHWNEKAASLTDMDAASAVGRHITEIVASHAEELQDSLEKCLKGQHPTCLETIMKKPDGKSKKEAIVQLSFSPRLDKHGHIVGVTLVGCDLTEVEAYREAETRKTRFMAVMSHELRSPLHGIIGLVGRLVEEEMDQDKERMLKMVSSCSSRLLDLVVNIMEMASLSQTDSQGKPKTLKLNQDPVELPKVIEEIVALVRNTVDKNGNTLLKAGVELKNEVTTLPIIEADAHRCSQVFYNLVTNACKFTQRGSVVISSRVARSGKWVEVEVKDSGSGISRKALSRIFEPFEQEDGTDRRPYDGVGLGLSIANEVVRLHGGKIQVTSETKQGSSFRVRLPTVFGRAMDEEEGDEPEVPDEPEVTMPATTRAPRARKQVLSVDDDEVNQLVIESILRSEYDVHTVMDGDAALAYIRDCGKDDLPDCVLLDVMMPGFSGFEVCRAIRRELFLDSQMLPVVMVSANPSPLAMSEGFDSGANDYITKPFDQGLLKSRMEAAMVPSADATPS